MYILTLYYVFVVQNKGHAINNMPDLARAHNSHARYVLLMCVLMNLSGAYLYMEERLFIETVR